MKRRNAAYRVGIYDVFGPQDATGDFYTNVEVAHGGGLPRTSGRRVEPFDSVGEFMVERDARLPVQSASRFARRWQTLPCSSVSEQDELTLIIVGGVLGGAVGAAQGALILAGVA